LLKKVVEIFEKLNVHKHINMMRKMHEEKHNVKNEDINIMQRVEIKTQKPKTTMHIYIFEKHNILQVGDSQDLKLKHHWKLQRY
jgi:hypothetical protein